MLVDLSTGAGRKKTKGTYRIRMPFVRQETQGTMGGWETCGGQ